MMRLPSFRSHAPQSAAEVATILNGEGPEAMIVAGGTDLYPNMKRRHQMPKTLVSLRHVDEMRGTNINGAIEIGANTTLRNLEYDGDLKAYLPPGLVVSGTTVFLEGRRYSLKEGDLVFVEHYVPCFACEWCHKGEYRLCAATVWR